MEKEYQIVEDLTGAKREQIKMHDDGFMSRGYVIGNGEIVFKFHRENRGDFEQEAELINYINTLNLKVNLPKVGWKSDTGEYLGLYGVLGESLEEKDYNARHVGEQLGDFLRQLHTAHPDNMEKLSLDKEIKAWQDRYYRARDLMQNYFDEQEMNRIDEIMVQDMPYGLHDLGEKLVLSHGDLGDGNILVDKTGKVGVIDWGEISYLDEAADFMDVQNDGLCEAMLDRYDADEALRGKVKIRRKIRPIIVFGTYVKRDERYIEDCMRKIRERSLGE